MYNLADSVSPEIINSLANLLWPMIVMIVLYQFRPAVSAIVESAKSRKFTLKIGGQELTMEEANHQQQLLISDLQKQINELKHSGHTISEQVVESDEFTTVTNSPSTTTSEQSSASMSDALSDIRRVLWVDDNPKNNAYYISDLMDRGYAVTTARSTAEGMRLFLNSEFGFIITDLGRLESDTYNARAGLDFLKSVREKDQLVPLAVFSSHRSIQDLKHELEQFDHISMTSSPTNLLAMFPEE